MYSLCVLITFLVVIIFLWVRLWYHTFIIFFCFIPYLGLLFRSWQWYLAVQNLFLWIILSYDGVFFALLRNTWNKLCLVYSCFLYSLYLFRLQPILTLPFFLPGIPIHACKLYSLFREAFQALHAMPVVRGSLF